MVSWITAYSKNKNALRSAGLWVASETRGTFHKFNDNNSIFRDNNSWIPVYTGVTKGDTMKKTDLIIGNFPARLSIPAFGLMVLFLIMAVMFSACSHKTPETAVHVTSGAGDDSGAKVKESFGSLPLYFIENRGQTDPKVSYYIKGKDKTLFFTRDGITFRTLYLQEIQLAASKYNFLPL